MQTVNGHPAIRITGANLQIVNGSGATAGTANGTGNLVVGYDEERSSVGVTSPECSLGTNPNDESIVTNADDCARAGGVFALNHKSGSHYMIAGQRANYSRWGGLVVGDFNTSNNDFGSVSGGLLNTASGVFSGVSGGKSCAANVTDGWFAGLACDNN